jgi:hypothetical protein
MTDLTPAAGLIFGAAPAALRSAPGTQILWLLREAPDDDLVRFLAAHALNVEERAATLHDVSHAALEQLNQAHAEMGRQRKRIADLREQLRKARRPA